MTGPRDSWYFGRYRPLVGDWDAFAAALSRPLPTCIWTNTLKTSPQALERRLSAGGLRLEPIRWYPGAFRIFPPDKPGRRVEYAAGLYVVQEEAALAPVALLATRPGERILDLCAAPGNKSAQIGVELRGSGTLVANDLRLARIKALRRTLDRLGLVNVCTTVHDAASYPAPDGTFDAVLVDVPCSCDGTSRKSPEVVARQSAGARLQLARLQLRMLRRAIELCRPGGRIVYSTCSLAPEENESVVSAALEELDGAVELLPARLPGFAAAAGISGWEGRSFDPSLERALRVWPHLNDTGGFFVALLRRS